MIINFSICYTILVSDFDRAQLCFRTEDPVLPEKCTPYLYAMCWNIVEEHQSWRGRGEERSRERERERPRDSGLHVLAGLMKQWWYQQYPSALSPKQIIFRSSRTLTVINQQDSDSDEVTSVFCIIQEWNVEPNHLPYLWNYQLKQENYF